MTRGMNLHLTLCDYDSEAMDLTVKRFSMHLFLPILFLITIAILIRIFFVDNLSLLKIRTKMQINSRI